MKKLINLLFFVGLITIFNASSCNKPDPEPELPTGENTAYYYLDGQLIIPKGYSNFPYSYIEPIEVGFCQEENRFYFSFNNLNERIHLYFKNAISNTEAIILNESNSGWNLCNNYNNVGILTLYDPSDDKYFFTENNTGAVTLNYLSSNQRQIKGTFEMDVYDSNGNVKHITDGHFNINLDTLR